MGSIRGRLGIQNLKQNKVEYKNDILEGSVQTRERNKYSQWKIDLYLNALNV